MERKMGIEIKMNEESMRLFQEVNINLKKIVELQERNIELMSRFGEGSLESVNSNLRSCEAPIKAKRRYKNLLNVYRKEIRSLKQNFAGEYRELIPFLKRIKSALGSGVDNFLLIQDDFIEYAKSRPAFANKIVNSGIFVATELYIISDHCRGLSQKRLEWKKKSAVGRQAVI